MQVHYVLETLLKSTIGHMKKTIILWKGKLWSHVGVTKADGCFFLHVFPIFTPYRQKESLIGATAVYGSIGAISFLWYWSKIHDFHTVCVDGIGAILCTSNNNRIICMLTINIIRGSRDYVFWPRLLWAVKKEIGTSFLRNLHRLHRYYKECRTLVLKVLLLWFLH